MRSCHLVPHPTSGLPEALIAPTWERSLKGTAERVRESVAQTVRRRVPPARANPKGQIANRPSVCRWPVRSPSRHALSPMRIVVSATEAQTERARRRAAIPQPAAASNSKDAVVGSGTRVTAVAMTWVPVRVTTSAGPPLSAK